MNTKNTYARNSQESASKRNPSPQNASKEVRAYSQGLKALKICPRRMPCTHPWCVFKAGMGILTVKLVEEGGDAVAQRGRRWIPGGGSGVAALGRMQKTQGRGGGCFVRGGERTGVVRGRRGLPRSPISRGGVVTAPVTTPPGSPASPGLCGFRVAVPARVYARHRMATGSFVLHVRGI